VLATLLSATKRRSIHYVGAGFRETKLRISNNLLKTKEYFDFLDVTSLFHEAEWRRVVGLVRRTHGARLESNKSKHP
jgi:hypothetical protein